MRTEDITTIDDIRMINRNMGYHFFDADTMRFFASRAGRLVYNGPGGVYFVTSEEFIDSNWQSHGRFYTVRQFITEGDYRGSINTIGEFNKMTRYEAHKLTRELAEGN